MCGRSILDVVKAGGGGVSVSFGEGGDFIWGRPPPSEGLTQRPEVLPRQLPAARHRLTKSLGCPDGFSGASYGHDLSEGDQVVAGFKERVASAEQREQDHTS